MRPISSTHFGPATGQVAITYHNGISVVTGYIVKQLGVVRYLVSDGTTQTIVHLAQNSADAATLTTVNGFHRATITLAENGNTHYIMKLLEKVAITTDGVQFSWTNGTPLESTIYPIQTVSAPITPLANTAAPTISGTAQSGQTLTASTGTWTGSPTSYTYQWSGNGTAISGATSSSYTAADSDVGHTITVTVTAIKSGTASVSATSTATAAVIAHA